MPSPGPQHETELTQRLRLLEAELPFLRRALLRHAVPPADAEDVAQDTVLVAARRWTAYDPARPLRPCRHPEPARSGPAQHGSGAMREHRAARPAAIRRPVTEPGIAPGVDLLTALAPPPRTPSSSRRARALRMPA